MRQRATWVVTFYALAASAACDRNPTGDEAREYFARHKRTVDVIDADIRAKVAALPGIGSPAPGCPTDASIEVHVQCEANRIEWSDRHFKAMRQYERDAVAYLDHPNVIGVKVTYISAEETGLQHLVDVGLTPGGYSNGLVEASKGITMDERRIGWGRFQTAYQPGGGKQYGDGVARPGIEVAWDFVEGGNTIHAQVWVLADHNPPADWREGFR